MKLLRNPWITGVLAITAIVLVFYQTFDPRWIRARSARDVGSLKGEAATTHEAATAQIENLVADLPARPVDREYAQARFSKWVNAPARDPFLYVPVVPDKSATAAVSPIPRWKLKAIWNQTGGRVAAINDHVYAEGDIIDGYRIEKIEGDQVWFQGPDRRERLGFGSPTPPAKPDPANQH